MTNGEDQGQQATWKVTRTEDAMVLGRGGLGQRGKRVYFRLLDGTESYVEVAMPDFNPQRVSDLVNQAAEQLYQVHTLQGPTVPLS